MTRTNRHNTKINTNYGEVDVEFEVMWTMDSHSNWSICNVDVLDYSDETVSYDTIVHRVIDYATYNCDPFGGDSDEETDYAS
ncbi:MAG: hypothetical protein ACK5P0_01515 [bacterium]